MRGIFRDQAQLFSYVSPEFACSTWASAAQDPRSAVMGMTKNAIKAIVGAINDLRRLTEAEVMALEKELLATFGGEAFAGWS
jgi:hypothetical protein